MQGQEWNERKIECGSIAGVNGSNQESENPVGKDRGKMVVAGEVSSADEVSLRVSNPSLAEGLIFLEKSWLEAARNPKLSMGNQRKMKERVLKEVTNKLKVGPIN